MLIGMTHASAKRTPFLGVLKFQHIFGEFNTSDYSPLSIFLNATKSNSFP